ncbi:MAG: hypothetical protein ABIC04_01970 [Nanoarchaeota archaeon]
MGNRMEDTSEKINTTGLRRYIKHLAIVSDKYREREDARDGLKKQIKKLTASSLGKKTKQHIMNEFRDLEKQVSIVLNKESEILRMKTEGVDYKNLMQEIGVNRKEIDEIKNSVVELNRKIDTLVDTKLGREVRIKKLEKRIKVSHKKKKELPVVSDKLMLLEKKYMQIKDDPKYTKEMLDKIKFKIDTLKVKTAISKF